jgi:hypothetical protein
MDLRWLRCGIIVGFQEAEGRRRQTMGALLERSTHPPRITATEKRGRGDSGHTSISR